MKKMLIATFSLGLVFSMSGYAAASLISEIEPNDPWGTFQNIDGDFSLGAQTGVTEYITGLGTIPWVSIEGSGDNISTAEVGSYGAQTVDYYSFTVADNTIGNFDIDFTSNIDSWLNLYNASGSLLAYDDDTGYDPGSTAGTSDYYYFDSSISYTFATAGTYVIAVGNYSGGSALSSGQAYTLQVAIEGHSTSDGPAPVPEPATMLLFGAGLSGLAAFSRRRKNTKN